MASIREGDRAIGKSPGRRRGARQALAAAVIALIAAAILIVVSSAGNRRPASTGPTAPRFTRQAAEAMSSDLRSGSVNRVDAALAISPTVHVTATAVAALGALRSVSFDPRTFRQHGNGVATINARVQPETGASETWVATLILEHGGWKLAFSSAAPTG